MIYKLTDTSKAEALFAGWEETLIWSCLQQVMGEIYVTSLEEPRCAMARVGDFAFFTGEPDKELVLGKPKGFLIMTPQNEAWAALIEECFPKAEKVIRYAIKKNAKFQKDKLEKMVASLPDGYEIRKIDGELYDLCLPEPDFMDFVSVFGSKEKFLELGRGMVVLKDGRIVAGASSYTRYKEGIEVEVDTLEEERGKGLASAVSAALILACLEEGLYPSWDAANMISVHLAEKLGYEFSHEYICYFYSD
ncbi:MAG: GNAT family N-acetyltransferase [Firmicutes bacterium]|nr:GNAT family N-acetyltransferase [Bacillota bacterium]